MSNENENKERIIDKLSKNGGAAVLVGFYLFGKEINREQAIEDWSDDEFTGEGFVNGSQTLIEIGFAELDAENNKYKLTQSGNDYMNNLISKTEQHLIGKEFRLKD